MNTTASSTGSIPEIISNTQELYLGNLVQYFRTVFFKANNCQYPYHNFRHMFHVLWLCYDACRHYEAELTKREMRNLLIAAMFHDFNHCGMMGDDDLNIARAVRALERNVLEEDKTEVENISFLIQATEYPYTVTSDQLTLAGQIIRDADVSQALSVAWIQQVVFGLAAEWRTQPIDVLKAQAGFLSNLSFTTSWAQQNFPAELIFKKIEESAQLLKLLEDQSQVS